MLRSRRFVVASACAVFLLIILLGFFHQSDFDLSSALYRGSAFGPYASSSLNPTSRLPSLLRNSQKTAVDRNGHFHFIIPATNSNKDLCRLLLTAVATDYPAPVFANWGAEIDADPYKVHMQKVRTILEYLDRLVDESGDEAAKLKTQNDLVLILDGFDIWLQLPPDVLLQRYYGVVDGANLRLAAALGQTDLAKGARMMRKHGVHNSIIFGPDKICWPEDPQRPACWAAPDSPLSPDAFGPNTDTHFWRHDNRPRWLNSGTILGPVEDVRTLFRTTLDRIANNYTVDSDQFYFADVWGAQEYNRRKLAGTIPNNLTQASWVYDGYNGEGHWEDLTWRTPADEEEKVEKNPEYHVMIDDESQLFQTVAYYDKWISWGHFAQPQTLEQADLRHDTNAENPPVTRPQSSDAIERITRKTHHKELPRDVASTQQPLSHYDPAAIPGVTEDKPSDQSLPLGVTWSDILLGYNTATSQIWGLIHFTPPKHWRDLWWFRMWFTPFAEQIIRARPKLRENKPYVTTRDGRSWIPFIPSPDVGEEQEGRRIGGAFTDQDRKWMHWEGLCGRFEVNVFANAPER